MTVQGMRDGIGRAGRAVGGELRTRGQAVLRQASEMTQGDGEMLAQGLGWFSIGLGLAEAAAPEEVARFIGVRPDDDNCAVLRACGLREIASGVGILTTGRPSSLLWGRVAGDLMDLFLLGTASGARETRKDRLAMAAVAVAGVTLLDVLGAQQLSQGIERQTLRRPRALRSGERAERSGRELRAPEGIRVTKVITVNRPIDQVYLFWHDFQNLAQFMSHLESVTVSDSRKSRWRAKAPAGMRVEWDAEITEDRPNELIAWRSLPGADVDNAGSVRFTPAPGGRGTEVKVELRYDPPGGAFGALVAKLFGESPEQQIAGDLRRFKQVMETGEVVHSDASIHHGMHAGQPSIRA